jgi:hypothetical protein
MELLNKNGRFKLLRERYFSVIESGFVKREVRGHHFVAFEERIHGFPVLCAGRSEISHRRVGFLRDNKSSIFHVFCHRTLSLRTAWTENIE